jgi:RNA polymerase sigma-70 factor (ECF subfamily)
MTAARDDDRNTAIDPLDRGVFEARYLAFLATLETLRPSLHRYCARMTGSVADGEDVVQEALFDAYQRLETYDSARPLKPWLFRIAHNRCIDFLRRRGVREDAEASAETEPYVSIADPTPELGRAIEHLVLVLPPMERACVLLKDVLDHSLEETADLIGSTVGGVKAALHRGRAKIAATTGLAAARTGTLPAAASAHATHSARELDVIARYAERFNRRDWDGLRELVRADARVRVADRFTGRIADSGYFSRYAQFAEPWRLMVTTVDDEPLLVAERLENDNWAVRGLMRVRVENDVIVEITDYKHCPWVFASADRMIHSRDHQ